MNNCLTEALEGVMSSGPGRNAARDVPGERGRQSSIGCVVQPSRPWVRFALKKNQQYKHRDYVVGSYRLLDQAHTVVQGDGKKGMDGEVQFKPPVFFFFFQCSRLRSTSASRVLKQ